jgi:hypothetical protein
MTTDEAHDKLLEELKKHDLEAGYLDSLELPSVQPRTPAPTPGGGEVANPPPPRHLDATPPEPAAAPMGDERPPIDFSKPLGWSPPPTPKAEPVRDVELEQAQANARDRRAGATLGQAVADYAERPTNFLDYAQRLGGGGASAPAPRSSVWKDYEAEGDRGLADLQARRQSETDLGAHQAASAKAAEARDPNSITARTYRMVLEKFSPGLQLDAATPEQMEKIAPWIEKFAAENADALKAQLAAAETKRKAELHDKERAEDLKNREQTHADAHELAKSNNAIAQASLGLRRDEATDRKESAAEKKLEDIPPGYELAEGAHPSAETRKKFTGLVSSAEKMKGLTAELRGALKGTDGYSRTMDPKTVTRLKQLGTMISIEGKNVAQLGALSGPDMALMDAIAADPTSIKTNLTVDLPRMLDQLDAWGDNSVAGESKASGIHKKGTSAGPSTRPGARTAAAPAGMVKMRFPNGEVDDVPEAEVAEAAKHGGVKL